ncbi:MAG: hypothetical protein ACI87A_001704, partial [Planctomycetota bacterium]
APAAPIAKTAKPVAQKSPKPGPTTKSGRSLTSHEICEKLASDPNVPLTGRGPLDALDAKMKEAFGTEGFVRPKILLSLQFAQELLQHGEVELCISTLQTALKLATEGDLAPELNKVERALGVAYLRGGEAQHCLIDHHSDSCLFPIDEKGQWPDASYAQLATGQFESYLSRNPNDPGARWLNGIAHMTAGTYSELIGTDIALPNSAIEATVLSPAFRDVAPMLGMAETRDIAGGVIIDDIDGDGLLDIVVSTGEACTPLSYFHNDGEAGFSDWSERSKLGDEVGCFNICQADFDNDGLLDILVVRGAWLKNWGRQRNSLLRQNEDGTFSDVTDQAGLGRFAYPTLGASWCDFDSDGDLDLYVPNEQLAGKEYSPSNLFRNEGNGTFSEIAKQAGVVNSRNGKAASWGDFDNDGDPDLFVANLGQPNRLYRNQADGKFTDVAADLGVQSTKPGDRSFASWFWDVNNDGALDLYVGGWGAFGVSEIAADYYGQPRKAERMKLFMNDGDGTFTDETVAYGLDHARVPMGANFGDIDNDGFLDFYLGTGAPLFEMLVPNVLYKNIEGKRFADVTTSARVGHLQKGHGIAFGDLDGDGDQDMFAQMGGWFPADGFANALFENPGSDNAWVTLRFVGVKANRSAIGTRFVLTVAGPNGERQLHRYVSSGGSFGASSLQQEVGLGDAERIVKLVIHWPGGQQGQEFADLPIRQRITITEGKPDYSAEILQAIQWPKD